MKITDVSTRLIDQYMFVQVDTDEGISGVGESGAWAFLEASEAVVETFKRYLIGQNPLLIEHHWQYMYRCYHFRGAAIMGALSAIDIALWDIKGKYYGVPCYELLGGKVRHKARVYYHVFGSTGEELIRGCRDAKARGFTAVGHLTPFVDSDRREIMPLESFAAKISTASERVYQYREAVGNEVDLCIEIHRQLNVPEAIALGREIEQARPMFFEDPVRPDNFDDMEKVAEEVGAGYSMAQSFENNAPYLPKTFIETVRAGEHTPGCMPVRRNNTGQKDCSPGRSQGSYGGAP